MTEQTVTRKTELLAAIERSWQALNTTLGRLSETQRTAVRDAQGWSVKDHVIHIAVWERSAIFMLQGRPRHLAVGVEESLFATGSDDDVNAVIYQQHRDLPWDQALAQLRAAHEQLVALVQPLTDADLLQPCRHYLPAAPIRGDGPLAITVIASNSAEHYVEHLAWIETLVGTVP
jgi:hypothetical protein